MKNDKKLSSENNMLMAGNYQSMQIKNEGEL